RVADLAPRARLADPARAPAGRTSRVRSARSLVDRRHPRGLCRDAGPRHRRPRAANHPPRREVQAQPEPIGGGYRRRHRGTRRRHAGRAGRSRGHARGGLRSMSTPPIIRPPALRPGDLVVVAALSGQLEAGDRAMYDRGVAELEALAFRVRPAPLVDVDKVWWWGPARPAEVGRELNELFRDPEVRAIWALTGGRFTLSYLDALDYDAIAANP